MRLIEDLRPLDPALGLALDEVLWATSRLRGQPGLRFWMNRLSAIIGRSQRAADEVDDLLASRLGVPILRRISGGGAVLHYAGNLNVSVYLHDARPYGLTVEKVFSRFGQAIAAGLARLVPGASAAANGIYVAERKLGGAAQARRGAACLYHTTLLVAPPPVSIPAILRAHHAVYAPKTIPSNPRSTVALAQIVRPPFPVQDVADIVKDALLASFGWTYASEPPDAAEMQAAASIAETKYRNPTWNRSR